MAHKVESMAWAGEVPWHGIGKRVRPDLTPAQMQKEAGLDWEVVRVPQYINFNGIPKSTGIDALVRNCPHYPEKHGDILTHIPDGWEEVQNSEAFEFFSEFVHEGGMEMHTAGSLRDGRMVWVLAKVKDDFTVFGKDRVDAYMLFSLPHEYGKSIDIRFTPIRVVCWNTLTLSLARKGDLMVKINHRKKFDPELVKQTLGIASGHMKNYKSMAQFLGTKRYTPENVIEYFKTIFPASGLKAERTDDEAAANDNGIKIKGAANMSRPATVAFKALEKQPGADFGAGTWWQAFNAVTFSIDHLLGHRTETRLDSAWYGVNRNRKLKALETAVEFANAA